MTVLEKNDTDWNWTLFLQTVNTLANSQGFYSRIKRDLDEMSEEEKNDIKKQVSSLPKFNDMLDVVLWLES